MRSTSDETHRRPCCSTREASVFALALGVAAVASVAGWLLAERMGMSADILFGDPAASTKSPVYLGVFSTLGLLLWTAAGVFFAVGSLAIRGDASRAACSRFMAGLCIISLVLLLDDWLLFHEKIATEQLHLPQKGIFAAYAVFAAGWFWWHRQVVASSPWPVLAIACVCGAISILIDSLLPRSNGTIAAEDGSKLLAIVAWSFYAGALALRSLPRRSP